MIDSNESVASPDSLSVDVLLQASLRPVQRWAHGRLPRAARSRFDTRDLVQEAALRMLGRRGTFVVRHPGAVEAYLRQTVLNVIRDEMRSLARRPQSVELKTDLQCHGAGPLQLAIGQQRRERYEQALRTLRSKDRRLIVANVEHERSAGEIARAFRLCSPEAARVSVYRALARLRERLKSAERLGGRERG
jgi:RNA polymerase sigma factor (sigma-70 family)